MITDKQLEEFQLIHKEVFGTEISKADALLEAPKLIQLMRIIYKPNKQTQQSSQQPETSKEPLFNNNKLNEQKRNRRNNQRSVNKAIR